MKLHLVNDQEINSERPKLGLGYLSSYLKTHMDDIEISVSFHGDDRFELIRRHRPDIIGLTATTASFNEIIQLGKEIKETFRIPIIIGGSHITILPGDLPEWIDAGVIGEGEQTLLEMIESYRDKGEIFNQDIRGIIYREAAQLRRTGEREVISPLDRIPSPDWDMLGLSSKGPGHILTSRGCTYKCVFCASAAIWKKIRLFSPEYVVREIKTIVEKFGRKEILIYDDLFTASSSRVRSISELICREGLDKVVKFECLSNVNHFDEETAYRLRRMNVQRISFGMESGSPEMLKYLKKGTVTKDKIVRAVKAGVDMGIEVLGSFMIGAPGETEEDMKMTYDFMRDLRLTEVGINVATPFPGTELWDYAVDKGLIKDEWDDSIFAMKTITPQTIKDKQLLCDTDKEKFIGIYKMMIDHDSMLIDRRVRVRTLKELVIESIDKSVFPGSRLKILDTRCEDGALGAAIKARIDAEITGITPDKDYMHDSMRRLDTVVRGGIEEVRSIYKEGYFDCIIFNEDVPDKETLRIYRELLGANGFIAGTFANRMHYSYLVYSLFGIDRPLFETTDGTYQYLQWGISEKDGFPGSTMSDIRTLMESGGYTFSSISEYRGMNSEFIEKVSHFLGTHLDRPDNFSNDSRVIRFFYSAHKTPSIAENDIAVSCPEKAGAEFNKMKDLVCSYIDSGKLKEAQRMLEEYLQLHLADSSALYMHADVCFKLGLSAKAVDSLDRILIFEPGRSDACELKEKIQLACTEH